MQEADTHAALRASPLARELDEAQVGRLAGVCEVRALADGEVLIDVGADDERLYAVAGGTLEVCRPGTHGELTPVHKVAEGDIVGEIGFLDGLPRTACVRAKGAATVVALERARLESLVESDPWLVYRVMRAVVRSIHGVVVGLNRDHSDLIGFVMR